MLEIILEKYEAKNPCCKSLLKMDRYTLHVLEEQIATYQENTLSLISFSVQQRSDNCG